MSIDLLLSNITKHVALTQEEQSFLQNMLQVKVLEPGDFLLREGIVCRHISFISKGCLKTYQMDENGLEHILDFLIEEWWADDLYSFFTGTAATCSIRAIEHTELLQISKADLENLYQAIPKFERFFRILFQNAYIAQKQQINLMLSATAEERYISFLKKKPYAVKRFSQKDIAAYLGITAQFFSTMKKKIG